MNRKQQLIQRRRKEKDIKKLIASGFPVTRSKANRNQLEVKMQGPKDSLYEGGLWRIIVVLPEEYPYKSPSLGFINHIFHPNIDFASGSICLNVINQTWSPMYDLVNILETFLPQLLQYPNPSDPLNKQAAELYDKCQDSYQKRVRDCVRKYAQEKKEKAEEIHRKTTMSSLTEMVGEGSERRGEEGEIECELSCQSKLSDLSDLSDVMKEEDIFM